MTLLGFQVVLFALLLAQPAQAQNVGGSVQSTVDVELARPLLLKDTTIAIAKFRAEAGDTIHLYHQSQRKHEIVRLGRRNWCRRIVNATDAFPYVCEYDVERNLDGSGPNSWEPYDPHMTLRLAIADPNDSGIVMVTPKNRPPCQPEHQPKGKYELGCSELVPMERAKP